jgi:hypothetical protein
VIGFDLWFCRPLSSCCFLCNSVESNIEFLSLLMFQTLSKIECCERVAVDGFGGQRVMVERYEELIRHYTTLIDSGNGFGGYS